MNFSKKYPDLEKTLHFFHQDWKIMFEWEGQIPSFQTAVRKIKTAYSLNERDNNTLALKELLSRDFDEPTLEKIVNDEFGSAFYPPGIGLSYREWLKEILSIFEEPISETKKHSLPKFAGEN